MIKGENESAEYVASFLRFAQNPTDGSIPVSREEIEEAIRLISLHFVIDCTVEDVIDVLTENQEQEQQQEKE